jgi:hypothetical protein
MRKSQKPKFMELEGSLEIMSKEEECISLWQVDCEDLVVAASIAELRTVRHYLNLGEKVQ